MTLTINGIAVATNVALTTAAVNADAFRMYSINGSNVEIDNISLTAIPEPSTYAAIFGALALGFIVLRRRRK
ncbi:MAG: PEP-CTERM sorting domain-containing protein [Verrucomicrobia bacterium]|nr:PEP-CTERM sorting domain-containing protein [Verrucomicrobiota bacterium]